MTLNKQDISDLTTYDLLAMHHKSDKDSSTSAQHHTLGFRRSQASPGDHSHTNSDGSHKLGTSTGLVLTGAKGGNTALANLITMLQTFIEFTDSTT